MNRLHRIIHGAAPYLVLAAVAWIAIDRTREPPPPLPAVRPTAVRTRLAPPPPPAETRVVHVWEDHRDARTARQEPPRDEVTPAAEPDASQDPAPDPAQDAARLARVDRSLELADEMIDRGHADPARADELRLLASQLAQEDRIELYARITTAVNADALQVDPDHLPL